MSAQQAALNDLMANLADLLAAMALGAGLPEDAERCLSAASSLYHHGDLAESYLFEARRLAQTISPC